MINECANKTYSLQCIAGLLENKDCHVLPDAGGRTRASVALIIRPLHDDLEVLFIQRAPHDKDPWSGHIAFPGGKWEDGEMVCQTACRETLEEIGIDLEQAHFLGRLSDIVGMNLPVWVSCCVYWIDCCGFDPVLSDEVSDVFWVKLSDIRDVNRHHQASVAFDERSFDVPAIRLPNHGKPVLWGITYRLISQFVELLDLFDMDVAKGAECCKIPKLIEINEEGL